MCREAPRRRPVEHPAGHVHRPVRIAQKNAPPAFGSTSIEKPPKYWRVNAGSVSACQTFSGVDAM